MAVKSQDRQADALEGILAELKIIRTYLTTMPSLPEPVPKKEISDEAWEEYLRLKKASKK